MAYFLGIDVGGTKTDCAIGNDSRMLALARGGSAKLARVGEVAAREVLHALVARACASADIHPPDIEAGCIGTSGASQPGVTQVLQAIMGEVVPVPISIVSDVEIAYAAAFGQAPGLVVISGTGSIAYGVNAAGEVERAGGWGPPDSDEGSAEWIGREIVRELHSGARSGLGDRLLQRARIFSSEELRRGGSPNFAGLLPEVVAAATSEDMLARDVLMRAGDALAELATQVIDLLWPLRGEVRVAMVGGVFDCAAMVRESFIKELTSVCEECRIELCPQKPVEGALMMARSAVAKGQIG